MKSRTLIVLSFGVFLLIGCGEEIQHHGFESSELSDDSIISAEEVFDLNFNSSEREMMRPSLENQQNSYQALRAMDLDNAERPALRFDPEMVGFHQQSENTGPRFSEVPAIERPENLNDLAFFSIGELGHLIRTRQVSCTELVQLTLDRLEYHGPKLECVVSLTKTRALVRARELDEMLDSGQYLGPLHGIPYGAKDLLAVEATLTTWGATPFKDQRLDQTATVIKKLDAEGAILVAKLTLGALAMDDVWFGGQTLNPWNLEEGSSGSSAGPASAVAAGLVPFALGSETLGSIVSPSTRCGVTGLRPSFGAVSRHGAMALSWSMDKLGPIARSVEDCAVVFEAIRGADSLDPTTVDRAFNYRSHGGLQGLRIGYLKSTFDSEYQGSTLDAKALAELRDAGAQLVPLEFPLDEFAVPNPWDLIIILTAEAGAAFQGLTLSNQDDLLVRQRPGDWPDIFRSAQLIPAVEYIQANRARVRLQAMMKQIFESVDVYVTPSLEGPSLMITNLTGHPQVVLPSGFINPKKPHSISFVGDLYDEATVLQVAKVYQDATGWAEQRPPGFIK